MIRDILAEGEGAARQRRAYSSGGIGAVLRALVDDTCGGITTPRTGSLPTDPYPRPPPVGPR